MKEMICPYPDKLPDWWIPKLHEGLAPVSADEREILEWCEANCCEPFYTYPSWTRKKGAQFESKQDAMNFRIWSALVWG